MNLKNRITEVVLSAPLLENDVNNVFKPGAHGNGIPVHLDHWEFGRKWVGEKITVQFGVKKTKEFVKLSKALPNVAIGFQGQLAARLTNPFENKIFKHLKAERVCSHLTKDNIKPVLDLEERLNEVCERIKVWNGV